jgi:hypothetical protein
MTPRDLDGLLEIDPQTLAERLNRGRVGAAVPPDWHPGPPELEELDRWYLEQHPEVRERMWARAHERRRRLA